ncbi:hypothetical protein BDV98DRAFT_566608 [Pterulicium gracile]|uniref:Cysteine alpha-hairpin motif superfamily n=1 Tax=Pterulicium gracile TaxID=1884261 RepID=A0A5C3QJI8_9AGAR|nr:hypothetical protein BDV98DRAFT_566608 [Pterula gracilis]
MPDSDSTTPLDSQKPEATIPKDYKKTFKNRQAKSQFVDPCQEASKASYDCMNRNNYNREACMEYFHAYRECKAIWFEQRKRDRARGVHVS